MSKLCPQFLMNIMGCPPLLLSSLHPVITRVTTSLASWFPQCWREAGAWGSTPQLRPSLPELHFILFLISVYVLCMCVCGICVRGVCVYVVCGICMVCVLCVCVYTIAEEAVRWLPLSFSPYFLRRSLLLTPKPHCFGKAPWQARS